LKRYIFYNEESSFKRWDRPIVSYNIAANEGYWVAEIGFVSGQFSPEKNKWRYGIDGCSFCRDRKLKNESQGYWKINWDSP